MGQFRVKNQKNSIRVENFWKWQRVVGQRQFYPKIHADPILLLKYVLFILFGFFRDRVNFDDYHRENIYLYDWPILMIITIFADIYNWFMRFTWSGNMLQWGNRSHRIPKELKVVSHFVALVGPGFWGPIRVSAGLYLGLLIRKHFRCGRLLFTVLGEY